MTSTTSGSAETAAELTEALRFRANAMEESALRLMGPLGSSRHSLRSILEVVRDFAVQVVPAAESEIVRSADDNDRVTTLAAYLRHCNSVLSLIESHLSHGTRRELSAGLGEEISETLTDLGFPDYRVVLSHGPADNYHTQWGDLRSAIFGPLAAPGVQAPTMPAALFTVPRTEGAGVLWRPVLLGHEAAHVAVANRQVVDGLELQQKFDFNTAGTIANPQTRQGSSLAAGLYEIATSWATELLCDGYALRAFGPAAIAAICEYFACINALSTPTASHPPGWLRLKLLFEQLGPVTEPRIDAVLEPWRAMQPAQPTYREPWAQFLVSLFEGMGSDIAAAVQTLPGSSYDYRSRLPWIFDIATDLNAGMPGSESKIVADAVEYASAADVVNASWLVRRERVDVPVDRLAQKTIESISMVRTWVNNGGALPNNLEVSPSAKAEGAQPDNAQTAMSGAAMSGEAVADRLAQTDRSRRLVVRPRLQSPSGSGIDLRLGHRLIVFGRTGVSSFDPLEKATDPRAIQNYVELGRGETFVLHPQEIVLGATLEYLVMPEDVSGQVITRSSYGRLGLITATAVQVHGAFRGCLTLELANLSTIPLVLTPGERIAQLVMWLATAQETKPSLKYDCPIGPEFSRVRQDPEADTLRAMRSMGS